MTLNLSPHEVVLSSTASTLAFWEIRKSTTVMPFLDIALYVAITSLSKSANLLETHMAPKYAHR